MSDDWAMAKLASFAEGHAREYGDPELVLAIMRARESMGCDPLPNSFDPMEIVDECKRAGFDIDPDVEREITELIDGE